jgi:hypothetical protein
MDIVQVARDWTTESRRKLVGGPKKRDEGRREETYPAKIGSSGAKSISLLAMKGRAL